MEKECKSRSLNKLDVKELINSMDELEFYSLIKIEKTKKEIKNSKFSLNVDLSELIRELDILKQVKLE